MVPCSLLQAFYLRIKSGLSVHGVYIPHGLIAVPCSPSAPDRALLRTVAACVAASTARAGWLAVIVLGATACHLW